MPANNPAANQFGALAATGVIHDALALTLKKLPFIKNMAKDVAPAAGYKFMPYGIAQILKDYNAPQNVFDRGATGTYAVQNGQVLPADKYVTLNNWPAVSIKISANEVNQIVDTYTNMDARAAAIAKLMERGMNAFATFIAQAYWNTITAANFPNSYGIAIGNMTYKELRAARDILFKSDVDWTTCCAILEPACFTEWCNSLTGLLSEEIVNEVIRTGSLDGTVSGLRSVSSYNLVYGNDINRGFVAAPEGVVMLQRLPEEETTPNDQVFLKPIVDDQTGFSVLYREFKSGETGEVTRTITTMLGFALGLSSHVARLTT